MESPEQEIYHEVELAQQANEIYDKILFNSHQLKIETSSIARTILSEVIDNYLEFAKLAGITHLFTEIKNERAGEDAL